eukprot:476777-Pyramimonas_sp.AAC.1
MDDSQLGHFFGVGKYSGGELNSPVAEWLNKACDGADGCTEWGRNLGQARQWAHLELEHAHETDALVRVLAAPDVHQHEHQRRAAHTPAPHVLPGCHYFGQEIIRIDQAASLLTHCEASFAHASFLEAGQGVGLNLYMTILINGMISPASWMRVFPTVKPNQSVGVAVCLFALDVRSPHKMLCVRMSV